MPTCMSAVPRSTGAPCSVASCKRPLVGAHRLAETALRDPDVRQGDGAADARRRCARPAAGSPCPRRTTGAPPRDPRSSRTRAPGAPLPLRARDGRPRRTRSSARRAWVTVPATSPSDQGLPGAVDGDRRREAAELLLVHDDHRRRRRPVAHAGRRVQPPLGVPQARLDALELAAGQQRPGIPVAEHGPDADQLVGERLEPAEQRRLLPTPGASPGIASSTRSAARSKSSAASAWRIASDRLAVPLVPRARPPVQLRRPGRAARPAGAPAARRRRGGGSDTTGAGRRAGRRRGSLAPAPPASPCRRPGR